MNSNIVFLDFETTGLYENKDYIIEIGAIKVDQNFNEIDRFHTLVKAPMILPKFITVLTGINDELLENAPRIEEIKEAFLEFLGDDLVIAHNADFEKKFFKYHILKIPKNKFIDSIELLALFFPNIGSLSLDTILKSIFEKVEKHRALEDAEDLYKVFQYLINRAKNPAMQKLVNYVYGRMDRFDWGFIWFLKYLKHMALEGTNKNLETKTEIINQNKSLLMTTGIDMPKIKKAIDKLPEKRKGQKEYLSYIASAFDKKENLMIEAGTGIGKTVGYLLPAFYYAHGGGKIVIATRTKNLQDQIMTKDIPLVKTILEEAKNISVTKVQGRENYICLRKLNKELMEDGLFDSIDSAYLSSYLFSLANISQSADLNMVPFYLKRKYDNLNAMLLSIKSESRTCQKKQCPYYNECHYFDMINRAKSSSILIANHALIFHWPKNLKIPEIAVFDEAHNILDESLSASTEQLSSFSLDYLIKSIEKYTSLKLKVEKANLKEFLLELENKIPNKTNYPVEKVLFPNIDKLNIDFTSLKLVFDSIMKNIAPILSLQIKEKDILEDLTALIEESAEILNPFLGNKEFSKKNVYWIYLNESKGEWRLSVAPSHPIELLEETYNSFESLVLTSATLYDAKFLGFENIIHNEYKIPSPFNYKENMKVLFLKNTVSPWHSSFVPELANTIESIARSFDGRLMGLFSNLKRLNAVSDILTSNMSDENFFVLKGCKDGMLNFFKNNPRSVILGSESCAEGVDIKGDDLVSILIERMPIVMKDPVTRVRMKTEPNWSEFELSKRVIKLRQWIGRLIRTHKDTGFVIIFDEWFSKQSPKTQTFIAKKLNPMPTLVVDYSFLDVVIKDMGKELKLYL